MREAYNRGLCIANAIVSAGPGITRQKIQDIDESCWGIGRPERLSKKEADGVAGAYSDGIIDQTEFKRITSAAGNARVGHVLTYLQSRSLYQETLIKARKNRKNSGQLVEFIDKMLVSPFRWAIEREVWTREVRAGTDDK